MTAVRSDSSQPKNGGGRDSGDIDMSIVTNHGGGSGVLAATGAASETLI